MKAVILNVGSVMTGEVLLRLGTFAAAVIIARIYGPVLLGIYAIALAYSSIAVTLADNGLMVSAVVEISKSPAEGSHILSQVYAAKLLLFIPMAAILVAVGAWVRLTELAWIVSILLTSKAIVQAYCQVNVGVLKSIDRMPLIVVGQGLNCVALFVGLALVYFMRWGISLLLMWMLGAQILEWVALYYFVSQFGIHIRSLPLLGCWDIVRRSTTMGVTYTVAALILRSDIIIASILFSTSEVGRFASAHMFLVAIYLAAWLFTSVILPDFVRLASDPDVLRLSVQKWARIIAAVTIPLCIALSLGARWIFPIVYGSQFRTASVLAAFMFLALPFIVLNSVYLSQQIALANPRAYLTIYVTTGVLSVVLSFMLGQFAGILGISIAIVLREVGMCAAFMLFKSPERAPNLAGYQPAD